MKRHAIGTFVLLSTLVLVLAACEPRAEQAAPDQEAEPTPQATQQVVDRPDTTGASMWAFLQRTNYQENWPTWPDKGELYTGQEPHGMLLTTYLNDAALEALTNKAGAMPDGAIVVKENYRPDSTLAAVTVMYKVAAYNAEHNDWFFTKHLPSGELDKMPNGMAMEGRLPGCQACHGTKKDNDYLFTGLIK